MDTAQSSVYTFCSYDRILFGTYTPRIETDSLFNCVKFHMANQNYVIIKISDLQIFRGDLHSTDEKINYRRMEVSIMNCATCHSFHGNDVEIITT